MRPPPDTRPQPQWPAGCREHRGAEPLTYLPTTTVVGQGAIQPYDCMPDPVPHCPALPVPSETADDLVQLTCSSPLQHGTPGPVSSLRQVLQVAGYRIPQEVLREKKVGKCTEQEGCFRATFQPSMYESCIVAGMQLITTIVVLAPPPVPAYATSWGTGSQPGSSSTAMDSGHHSAPSTFVL